MRSVKDPRKDIKRGECVCSSVLICALKRFSQVHREKSPEICYYNAQERGIIRAREELLDQADSRDAVLTLQT